ncbi:glutamate receptor ionotropic, delta-2-like isoform X2 [Panulirus ornatus]|uniref:glutamate receptor ionotropic, delta-2-like isoform X2 n=1 Tax=Panulirus ornatus TaxID=150431 RepID=UPI003A8714FE
MWWRLWRALLRVLVVGCVAGVEEEDDQTLCQYPGLTHFLLDYTSHYTYTEVHIVVTGQEEDTELLVAARRLLLLGHTWTTNIINVARRPDQLRTLSVPSATTPYATMVRATAQPPSSQAPPDDHHSSFTKPVFITTVATALALHSILDWKIGEEARSVPWLVIGVTMKPLLTHQHYFPLDNMVLLALWPDGGTRHRVQLWEVYQAARVLPHRISKVGLWRPPQALAHLGPPCPRASSSGHGQQEQEEKQEEEVTYFPNLNIATRRLDLTGLHIRCLTESWQPFTNNRPLKGGGVTIGGFMGETFQLMSDFFNFTYECRSAPDDQFGDYEDGAWTGLVGELVAGRGDVIVTALDSTYHRSQVIGFCFPSGDIEYILIIRKPEADPWSNFTRQLQPATWLACLAFVVLAPVLYFFLASRSPFLVTLTLQDSWFTIQTLLLNQGNLCVQGLARRVFFLTVVMTTWLIITFYTSVLVSYLTVPLITPPFTDMAGLLRKGTHSLGLQKGNSEVERLRTSQDPMLQEVWSKIVVKDPANLVPTSEEGLQKVLEEKFVFLMEKNYYQFHMGGDCTTTTLREKVFTFGAGIAVQKDSPLRLVFSHHTLVQHVSGIMDRSRRRHQPAMPSCSTQVVEALGLPPLVTVFIVLVVAIPLAILFLLLEWVVSKAMQRHSTKTPDKRGAHNRLQQRQQRRQQHPHPRPPLPHTLWGQPVTQLLDLVNSPR